MNRYKVFKKVYPDIEQYLNNILKEEPWFEKPLSVLKSIIFDIKIKKCKQCGKIIPFSKRGHDFCCKRCAQINIETKLKIENTCLKKYGVKNTFVLGNTVESREKSKQTFLKKYGTTSYMKSEEFLEKKKKTMIEKYGVDHPSKSKEIREKRIKTYIERFGVKNPLQNKDVRNKSKETSLKKYGVEYWNQAEIAKNRSRQNSLNRGYDTIINEWKDYAIPLFSREEYEGYKSNKEYEWKCVKCGKIFRQRIYITNFLKDKISKYVARCPDCYPLIKTNHNIDELNKQRQDSAYENILKYKDYVIPLFSREEYDRFWKNI